MKNRLALIAATLVALTSPSVASGATISFYPQNAGVPNYGTASIIESFTGVDGTSAFPTGTTKTINVSTTAYTGTLTETVDPSQVGQANGATFARYALGATGITGTGLKLKGGSITLDFGASGIQFLKFIISNYQTSSNLFV
ncbi:MAG: hypothetical protein ABIQ66_07510, partial [Novosphingobium sp.]